MLSDLVWHRLPPKISRNMFLKEDLITFDPSELNVSYLIWFFFFFFTKYSHLYYN